MQSGEDRIERGGQHEHRDLQGARWLVVVFQVVQRGRRRVKTLDSRVDAGKECGGKGAGILDVTIVEISGSRKLREIVERFRMSDESRHDGVEQLLRLETRERDRRLVDAGNGSAAPAGSLRIAATAG